MKKILLAVSLLLAGATFANANNVTVVTIASGDGVHISASQVPGPVLASFNSMFPGATRVRWEREREHGKTTYQADFVLNGKRMKATFAADGTYLGR
jgi:hypothetical protein